MESSSATRGAVNSVRLRAGRVRETIDGAADRQTYRVPEDGAEDADSERWFMVCDYGEDAPVTGVSFR